MTTAQHETKSPFLALGFENLLDRCRTYGSPQHWQLHGGCHVAVKIDKETGEIVVCLRRRGVDVGAREIEIFKRDFGIPADARRNPQHGQSTMPDRDGDANDWHCVVYHWQDARAVEVHHADLH